MIRPDISRLNKNRSIYLKVGFICSLSFMFLAFNWTTDFYVPEEKQIVLDGEPPIQMMRTIQEKKRLPPPPVVAPTIEPVIEEFEMTTEPITETIDEPISEPQALEQEQIIAAPVPKPAPIPPAPVAKEEGPGEIFAVVEEMPRFPGCEDQKMSKAEKKSCAEKAMLEYVYSHIKYPSLARSSGIEGIAAVSFVVEKDGSLQDFQIVRDPGGGLGKEASRVVKLMPKWIPGKQRGNAVRVKYTLPVKYKLQ